ncbi:MAG TPA: hypothetical protein VGR00_12845, partial [Thermoanaerobaculia bacterium]|nr:hypothetical protein [Thermoanaerobaculia bacterium]
MTTPQNRFAMLALSSLVALSTSAPAESLAWRAVGPGGENVYSLVLDPTNTKIVYAGSRLGLYKSTDGGSTWVSGKGLEKSSILCMAVDPKNPKTLYAGVYGGGVYRSLDGGATWKNPTAPAKGGLPGFSTNEVPRGAPVHAIAIDPSNPKKLFAGGLYETADGGANWKRVSAQYGGGISDVKALAIDPKNPKVV